MQVNLEFKASLKLTFSSKEEFSYPIQMRTGELHNTPIRILKTTQFRIKDVFEHEF